MKHKDESIPFPQSKKYKRPDGTIAYTWDGKMHNWEGPAFIPEGNKKLAEYYLYGTKMSKDEWQEIRSQREGLPYYKNQSMKAHLSDYRN